MTKDVGILILGLLVAAMPFLGFPGSYERIIFLFAGLIIALLAFLIRGDFSYFDMPEQNDTYAQNGGGKREEESHSTVETQEVYEKTQEHTQ